MEAPFKKKQRKKSGRPRPDERKKKKKNELYEIQGHRKVIFGDKQDELL